MSKSNLFYRYPDDISTELPKHLEQSNNRFIFRSNWCMQDLYFLIKSIFPFLAWCRSWTFSLILPDWLIVHPKIWYIHQHQQWWFFCCNASRIRHDQHGKAFMGQCSPQIWLNFLTKAEVCHITMNSKHYRPRIQHKNKHQTTQIDQI